MKRWIFSFMLLLALAAMASAGNDFTEARKYEPVIITGAQLPGLQGVDPGTILGFVYDAASGTWRQIPFQVDERKLTDISYDGKNWGREYLYLDDEGNGFDEDDEIVFMVEDLGDKAPAPAQSWAADTDGKRFEVAISDPLKPGTTGYIYIYTSTKIESAGQSYVNYTMYESSENKAIIDTDHYQAHYSRRWVLDRIILKSPLQGDGKTDLVDRFKFRAYALTWENESEDFWSDGPGQCLYRVSSGKPCSWYLGHKTGPVRAIRMVQGAASGPTTMYFSFFYRKMIGYEISYRVHALPRMWYYMDYSAATTNKKYYDKNNTAIPVDGVPDNVNKELSSWAQVTSDQGTIITWMDVRQYLAMNGVSVEAYYLDNAAFNDETGEDKMAIGNHGVFIQNIPDILQTYDSIRSYARFFLLPPKAANQGAEYDLNSWTPLTVNIAEQQTDNPPSGVGDAGLHPDNFNLQPAYPNPFAVKKNGGSVAGGMTIRFNLPQREKIAVFIYDIQGRLVKRLFEGTREGGEHTLVWNGRNENGDLLSTGTYYIELRGARQRVSQKITIVR